MERLKTFRLQASDLDRIVLVFATDRPMSEVERQTLADVRSMGRLKLDNLFDVEDVSLQTIWETGDHPQEPSLSLSIHGNFVDLSPGLRVGTIPLIDLYAFLKSYRDKTGNLDQLYEKNVRQFLGSRKKINKGIARTLRDQPDMFGLFNNGITIVVTHYSTKSDGSCMLFEPYVVNGCQTTRTIWEVMSQYIEAGGTGRNETLEKWRSNVERGVVVAKIVRGDKAQIREITQFTNSQNAVRDQDFLALRDVVRSWADAMARRYDIFLEIQRGGWESQRAFQRSHPSSRQFNESVNAFDLIKIYGAAWLREPGTAFGKSGPFTPGGPIFKRIISQEESTFDVDDLYVAYRLKGIADSFRFGRGAVEISRRQTRFLFYFFVMDLLRDTLIRNLHPHSSRSLTLSMLALLNHHDTDPLASLVNAALEVISEYLNQTSEDCVYKEPTFQGDLNTFLKWEQLGKHEDATPRLKSLLAAHRTFVGRTMGGQTAPREAVSRVIGNAALDA